MMVFAEQVRSFAEQADLSTDPVDAIVTEYANAQITALKAAFAAIALFALLALWCVRRLPTRVSGDDPTEAPSPAGEVGPALSG